MAVRSGHVTNPIETLASAKAEVPADGLLLRESENADSREGWRSRTGFRRKRTRTVPGPCRGC
jgi:hypothetical protein